MRLIEDIVIQLHPSGFWIFYNTFTRDTLATTSEIFAVLSSLASNVQKDEIIRVHNTGAKFRVWEIGFFSNADGLLADPTGRIRDNKNWPEPLELNIEELLETLRAHHFIVNDENAYAEFLGPKATLLDRSHRGNFHQQLGQALILDRKMDPSHWWVDQKFNSDRTDLKTTLYQSVQEHFLKSFVPSKFKAGDEVVDIGCGIGYYSKLIGRVGAQVLGIDPSQDYINAAQESNAMENVSFRVSKIGQKGDLDWIEGKSVDYVVMTDVLLFYFFSPNPREKPNMDILFSDIKRILKKGGRFISIEPNGMFWLQPWLGEEDRPFTVITEYRDRRYSVAPSTAQLAMTFVAKGFTIKDMKELYADGPLPEDMYRAKKFAQTFPLWHFFELEISEYAQK